MQVFARRQRIAASSIAEPCLPPQSPQMRAICCAPFIRCRRDPDSFDISPSARYTSPHWLEGQTAAMRRMGLHCVGRIKRRVPAERVESPGAAGVSARKPARPGIGACLLMAAVAGFAGLLPADTSAAQTSEPSEASAFSGLADLQFKGRPVVAVDIRGNTSGLIQHHSKPDPHAGRGAVRPGHRGRGLPAHLQPAEVLQRRGQGRADGRAASSSSSS